MTQESLAARGHCQRARPVAARCHLEGIRPDFICLSKGLSAAPTEANVDRLVHDLQRSSSVRLLP